MQSLNEFERLGFCMSWGDLRRDVHAVGVSKVLGLLQGRKDVVARAAGARVNVAAGAGGFGAEDDAIYQRAVEDVRRQDALERVHRSRRR